MDEYKMMYYKLFNSITTAINVLQQAQIDVEEMLLSADEDNKIVQLYEMTSEDNSKE